MPRFNVQHPKTKEWRCFSTIVDDWVTDWMDEKKYQAWRELEYGRSAGDLRNANQMSLDEAEAIIRNCEKNEVTDDDSTFNNIHNSAAGDDSLGGA